jgi:hypothetical protein
MTPIPLLGAWILRSTGLILAGVLMLRLLRVKNPSVRLAALTAMLAGSLAIPLLSVALPKVAVFHLPTPAARIARSARAVIAPPASHSIPDPLPLPPPSQPAPVRPIDWMRLAAILYAAIAGALLLRLLAGLCLTLLMLRHSRPAGIVHEGVPIRESAEVASPVTIGLFRPSMLLPVNWREWESATLEAVLAHEGSHVRRRDPALQFLSAIHRALLWASPMGWLLHRRIVRAGEEISDDAAIAATGDRASYAGVLLEFMQRSVTRADWATVPMARYDRPEKRIRRILDSAAISPSATRRSVAAILALAAPLAWLAAAANPQADATQELPRFEIGSLKLAAAGLPQSAKAALDAYQAILADGWHTSPAEAAQLESQLASHPHDVAARTRLISYYYQQMIAEPRTRHILWLIENHPEAEVFRFASDVTSLEVTWHGLNRAADSDKARALWLRQTERFSTDTAVLANAAQALPVEESIPVLRRLRMLGPSNPVWTVNLASVYAWAVRDAFEASSPIKRRAIRGTVRYRDMWQMRLHHAGPELAEKLKNELESSSDSALVGVTGELLVEQLVVLSEQDQTPDVVQGAAFGKQLLERARRLDPTNPEWGR